MSVVSLRSRPVGKAKLSSASRKTEPIQKFSPEDRILFHYATNPHCFWALILCIRGQTLQIEIKSGGNGKFKLKSAQIQIIWKKTLAQVGFRTYDKVFEVFLETDVHFDAENLALNF